MASPPCTAAAKCNHCDLKAALAPGRPTARFPASIGVGPLSRAPTAPLANPIGSLAAGFDQGCRRAPYALLGMALALVEIGSVTRHTPPQLQSARPAWFRPLTRRPRRHIRAWAFTAQD